GGGTVGDWSRGAWDAGGCGGGAGLGGGGGGEKQVGGGLGLLIWPKTSSFFPGDPAGPAVERRLAEARYDCVVIGAGVRLPPSRLVLFEALVNAIHRAAPSAAIAFNTRPEDTGATAARWI